MACLHDPRLHEKRDVNSRRLVVKQASFTLAGRAKTGYRGGSRFPRQQKGPDVIPVEASFCRPKHGFPTEGVVCGMKYGRENHRGGPKGSRGRGTEWRHDGLVRRVVLAPSQRENSARWTRGIRARLGFEGPGCRQSFVRQEAVEQALSRQRQT